MSHSELMNLLFVTFSLTIGYVLVMLALMVMNRPNIKPVAIMFTFAYIIVWICVPCYKYVAPSVDQFIGSL